MEQKMKFLASLILIVHQLVCFLPALGALIAGIWLVTLHEWKTLISGLLIFLSAQAILGLALGPVALLVARVAKLKDRGHQTTSLLIEAVANVYFAMMMTIWCCAIMMFFMMDVNGKNIIPTIIWSYGIAVAPWVALLWSERPKATFGFLFHVFFAQIAYLVIALLLLHTSTTNLQAIVVFSCIMTISVILCIGEVISLHKPRAEKS